MAEERMSREMPTLPGLAMARPVDSQNGPGWRDGWEDGLTLDNAWCRLQMLTLVAFQVAVYRFRSSKPGQDPPVLRIE